MAFWKKREDAFRENFWMPHCRLPPCRAIGDLNFLYHALPEHRPVLFRLFPIDKDVATVMSQRAAIQTCTSSGFKTTQPAAGKLGVSLKPTSSRLPRTNSKES